MASSVEKEEEALSVELPAPSGWKKKYFPKKSGTPRKSEIVFISPTGEEFTHKRQLDQYLKAHPGGPPSSEFDWGTGETPRRSARISEKVKASPAQDSETPKKRSKKSPASKKANKEPETAAEGNEEAKETVEGAETTDKDQADKEVEKDAVKDNEEVKGDAANDPEESKKDVEMESADSKENLGDAEESKKDAETEPASSKENLGDAEESKKDAETEPASSKENQGDAGIATGEDKIELPQAEAEKEHGSEDQPKAGPADVEEKKIEDEREEKEKKTAPEPVGDIKEKVVANDTSKEGDNEISSKAEGVTENGSSPGVVKP